LFTGFSNQEIHHVPLKGKDGDETEFSKQREGQKTTVWGR
jgi:hypothetical protein